MSKHLNLAFGDCADGVLLHQLPVVLLRALEVSISSAASVAKEGTLTGLCDGDGGANLGLVDGEEDGLRRWSNQGSRGRAAVGQAARARGTLGLLLTQGSPNGHISRLKLKG